MNKTREQLLQVVKKSMDASTDYHAVYIKYKKNRYGAISEFITAQVSLILDANS